MRLLSAQSNNSFAFDKLRKRLAIHIEVHLRLLKFYFDKFSCDFALQAYLFLLQIYFYSLILLNIIAKSENLALETLIPGVSLVRNGPARDAGHFVPFRDCPGQSGTAGHPNTIRSNVRIITADLLP